MKMILKEIDVGEDFPLDPEDYQDVLNIIIQATEQHKAQMVRFRDRRTSSRSKLQCSTLLSNRF